MAPVTGCWCWRRWRLELAAAWGGKLGLEEQAWDEAIGVRVG